MAEFGVKKWIRKNGLILFVSALAFVKPFGVQASEQMWTGLFELIENGSGYIEDSVYINEAYGFQIVLPDEMEFLSEDEVGEINSNVNEILEDVVNGTAAAWEQGMMYTDMVLANYETGANINVSFGYDPNWTDWSNQNFYEMQEPFLEQVEAMHEASGFYDGEVELTIEQTEFLGESVSSMVTYAIINGKPVYQRQVTICEEGNRVTITAAADNNETVKKMIASVDRLAAGTHPGPVSEKIVRAVQENLNMQGYDCGVPDGIFGDMTRSAILSFQQSNGMIADGVISNGLLSALGVPGQVAEQMPIKINNIYYEFNETGTGIITIYFDNLTKSEYKAVRIYFQLFDKNGVFLGEEDAYCMNVPALDIIQGKSQVQIKDVWKISIYKYGFKGYDGEEVQYKLTEPITYTIEEIQKGHAKRQSSFVNDEPEYFGEIMDTSVLESMLSYLGKYEYEIPGDLYGSSCILYGYNGYFSGLLGVDGSFDHILWNLDGSVSTEILNQILGEIISDYVVYDEEIMWDVAEKHYIWKNINGYSVAVRYTPEEKQQLVISWGDSSEISEWSVIG